MKKFNNTRKENKNKMLPNLPFVLILSAYGIIYAPSVVFAVLRCGVFERTVDNALKTLLISKMEKRKHNLHRNLKTFREFKLP